MLIVVAFFVLQVIVFNAGNHVLSERNVAADHIALEAFVAKCIISTVHGVSNGGYSGLIIVFAIEAPAASFALLRTGPTHADNETIVIIVFGGASQEVIITLEVHRTEGESATVISSSCRPDLVVAFKAHSIFIIDMEIVCSKVEVTNGAAQFSHPIVICFGGFRQIYNFSLVFMFLLPTIGAFISHLAIFSSEVSSTERNNGFDAIDTGIIDVTISDKVIVTTSRDVDYTDVTSKICSLEVRIIITGFILATEVLDVTEHSHIMPVVVYFARKEDIRTEVRSIFSFAIKSAAAVSFVTEFYSARNLDVVSVLFETSHANTEVIQFVSKFANQFVISTNGAFSKGFGHDLSHFITGHGAVAFVGTIGIAINDTSSSQFSDSCIGPVASRNIREGVSSKSGSGYAEGHCHCKNQALFHVCFLLRK